LRGDIPPGWKRYSPRIARILSGSMNIRIKYGEGKANKRQTQMKAFQFFPSQVQTDPVLVC
jgi:hypothetical protein